jgi:hypothetical protein
MAKGLHKGPICRKLIIGKEETLCPEIPEKIFHFIDEPWDGEMARAASP